MVLDVAFQKENDNIMASCSEDGEIIVWDIRLPCPALGTDLFLLYVFNKKVVIFLHDSFCV